MSRIVIAVVVAAVALTTFAQARADAPRGFFVDLQFGRADYDVRLRGDAPWWGDVDERGTVVAAALGYELTPNLAMRGMYEQARGIGARNVCPDGQPCPMVAFRESTDTDAWSLVAMPRLPMGNGWELCATLGAMRWRVDPDNDRGFGRIASDSATHFVYGAVLGYRFDNGVRIGIEHQRARGGDYEATRASLGFGF
jgi:hypothetical protein